MITLKPQLNKSVSIFNGNDLVDEAYNGLISMLDIIPEKDRDVMVNQISGNTGKVMDHYNSVIDGIYIPGSERVYWSGTFDIGVDEFPENGCVYISPKSNEQFKYCHIKKIPKLPKRVFCGCQSYAAAYKVIIATIPKNKDNCSISLVESYFIVTNKGKIVTALDVSIHREYYQTPESYNALIYGAGALSLLADRKYLWNVQAIENYDGRDLKINFGIEEQHIKSLLFARDAPMTQAGRKRPILHWVEQHKRRIKEGVDVNIDKYLRGINELTMGNLKFVIDNPKKKDTRKNELLSSGEQSA